jgi:hypothetical protein
MADASRSDTTSPTEILGKILAKLSGTGDNSTLDDFREQDIPAIIVRLNNISDSLGNMMTSLGRLAGQIDKPPVIKSSSEDEEVDPAEVKTSKKDTNALQTISNHLKDIKVFLKSTFSTDDKLSGDEKKRHTKRLDSKVLDPKKEKEEAKTSSLPWLSMLFAGGALAGITKVFGIGAGAGVGGGLLAKLLPKIFKVGKAVFKRIPIIGSLFSFYEAYKHFQKGGIDSIIFGLLDVVAGIAYMVPGIGTVIGIGVDVLSYFLQNKAEEYKEESGSASFFGSLSEKVLDYLKKTPIFKWFTHLGEKGKAFWDDPKWETLKPFLTHFGDLFGSLLSTFGMFNDDAGAALGLEDESGQSRGLLGWIGEKIDEWIITPIMDFFGSVFKKVGEMMAKINAGILGFIGRALDNIEFPPGTGWIKTLVQEKLGLATNKSPAERRTQKMAEEQERAPEALGAFEKGYKNKDYLKRKAIQYNTTIPEFSAYTDYKKEQSDQAKGALPFEQWRDDKAAKLKGQLQQKKDMETERIPSKYDLDVSLQSRPTNQTQHNTSVNTTIHNEIHEPPPSDVFNPGFRYQFSRP